MGGSMSVADQILLIELQVKLTRVLGGLGDKLDNVEEIIQPIRDLSATIAAELKKVGVDMHDADGPLHTKISGLDASDGITIKLLKDTKSLLKKIIWIGISLFITLSIAVGTNLFSDKGDKEEHLVQWELTQDKAGHDVFYKKFGNDTLFHR